MASDGNGSDATAATVASNETGGDGANATGGDAQGPSGPKRYERGREIGRGGIGRVLAARDRVLERDVALKELHGEAGGARFAREAKLTARLQHPSIVPVYDAGRWPDGATFYTMKLVDGRALSEIVAATASLDERLALVPTVLAVADAIAYAHRRRIVHRDLKPQNVLVGEFGETIVIDWGLAKDLASGDDDGARSPVASSGGGELTVAGAVLGTPAYMAPEQAAGRDIDERTDVYALGALLYFVLARCAPHDGATSADLVAAARDARAVPLVDVAPGVPGDLAAIVAKAMARDPAQRYASGREFADDLRRFTTGKLVAAHRYGGGERVRRWLRRYRAIAITAGVSLAVLVGSGAWSMYRMRDERDAANAARDAEATARAQLADRANRALVGQAENALARDPAAALAWLRQLDPQGGSWPEARDVAARALSEPLPKYILRGVPPGAQLELDESRRFLVGSHDAAIWIGDVTTGAVRRLTAGTKLHYFRSCADGHGRGGEYRGDDIWDIDVELATGKVVEVKQSDAVRAGIKPDPSPCTRHELVGRRWVAAGKTQQHPLDQRYRGYTITADRKHVIALGQYDDIAEIEHHGTPTSFAWWDDSSSEPRVLAGVLYGRDPFAVSADGTIGGALHGKTLTTWNVTTGQRWTKEIDGAIAIAAEPSGAWFAIASRDRIVLVAPDGTIVDRLTVAAPIDEPRIAELRVSPGGRWLVLVETGAQIWDLRGARRPRRIPGRLREIVFGPHDELVAIGDRDREVRVFDPDEAVVAYAARADVVALSPNARWVVAANATAIERIELRAPAKRDRRPWKQELEHGELAISDAGDVGTCLGGAVTLWPHDGEPAPVGRQHVDDPGARDETKDKLVVPCAIAMTDDAAITADRSSVVEWRAGAAAKRYDAYASGVLAPDVHASRAIVLVDDVIVDRATGEAKPIDGTSNGVRSVFASPDLSLVATSRPYEPIAVVMRVADRTSREIAIGEQLVGVAFAPDGASIVVLDRAGTMSRIVLATGAVTVLDTVGGDTSWETMHFIDGRTLATDELDAVRFRDLDRARTDRSIATERVDPAANDVRSARAIGVVDGALVVATGHAVRTIRDDLPVGPALRARLGRYVIDPATAAVTVEP